MTLQSYGVMQPPGADKDPDWLVRALEDLERVGFTMLTDQIEGDLLAALRAALDRVLAAQTQRFGGVAALEGIGEAGQARALCNEDPLFWELATLPRVDAVIERLLGPAAIVMQQNGVVMPTGAQGHQQQRWHRDLPYQSWVSSAPIAIGALCALDAFSAQSGGTTFLPASHRFGAFPSEEFIRRWEHGIEAPAGSIILFDAMTFHRGGINRGDAPRRAINTLFGVPLLAQQVTLTAPADASELIRRRCGVAYRPAGSADEYRAGRLARTRKASDDS
ncbi:MAG: phytanoyl-CoA dioxygenase family protein [Ramlibacter sp.]